MNPTASIGASVRRQSRADVRHLQSVLDTSTAAVQNGVAVFNQAAKNRNLEAERQASRPNASDVGGISYACIPQSCLFNGGQGQGGLMPDGTFCHYCEPCLLSAAPHFATQSGLNNQNEKADSMKSTASIGVSVRRQSRAVRKGFTRPLFVRPVRTFPTFEQASRFVAVRLGSRAVHRLAVQQTAQGSWAVCRVLQGGV